VVVFGDECHLRWGDVTGHAWGKRGERVTVPVVNTRKRQTYYGAVNFVTGSAFVMPYRAGNGAGTVQFLKALRRNVQGRPLVMIWDGASYHRSKQVKAYLRTLNGTRPVTERLIHLERFAPNAPEQNPMEDVWLAGKNWVRKHFASITTFERVNYLFVNRIHAFALKSEKFDWYGRSQII
jgi:transposase